MTIFLSVDKAEAHSMSFLQDLSFLQLRFSPVITSLSHTLGLALLPSLFCSSKSHAPIPSSPSQNNLHKFLSYIICFFGETHAKQQLSQKLQHASLRSHKFQSFLHYPLAYCATCFPLISKSAHICFLFFFSNTL